MKLDEHLTNNRRHEARIKTRISDDIWNIIQDNYEKGSYTTSITSLLQYANEVVREKAV